MQMDRGYNRVKNGNLWNEPQRLSPKFSRFTLSSHAFRKTPVDLEAIEKGEKDDSFARSATQFHASRQASHERVKARRLERLIINHKSNQQMPEELKQQMHQFESEDPTLFEELSLKKKWTNVMKDPTRANKDIGLNNSFWGLLNHLPPRGVDSIVN